MREYRIDRALDLVASFVIGRRVCIWLSHHNFARERMEEALGRELLEAMARQQ